MFNYGWFCSSGIRHVTASDRNFSSGFSPFLSDTIRTVRYIGIKKAKTKTLGNGWCSIELEILNQRNMRWKVRNSETGENYFKNFSGNQVTNFPKILVISKEHVSDRLLQVFPSLFLSYLAVFVICCFTTRLCCFFCPNESFKICHI